MGKLNLWWISVLAVISLGVVSIAQEEPAARVDSFIISPHMFTDNGDGVETHLRITFFEPARADGIIHLKIIPALNRSGDLRWENGTTELDIPFRRDMAVVSYIDRMHVIKSGTVAIQASVPFDFDNVNTYWMDVELRSQ
jgi:hypothetical protein